MELPHELIARFFEGCYPFSALPVGVRDDVVGRTRVRSLSRGEVVLDLGECSDRLFVIHAGAVELRASDGGLEGVLSEGDAFGVRALIGEGVAPYRATAAVDSVLLEISGEDFFELRRCHPSFERFFSPDGTHRMRAMTAAAPASADQQLRLLNERTRELMSANPVSLGPTETIRAAARIMRERDISCLPVLRGGDLIGIVTVTDLRDRVVAEGIDVDAPLEAIMTVGPISIDVDSTAFDALLTMTQRNVSHLLVTESGRLVGVITNTNLVRRQTASAVYMVGDIFRRSDYEGLAEVVRQVPQLLVQLVEAGASAHNVGHIVTSVCDAVTRRLLQLAAARLGDAPVPYLWLACGSQGRQEQTGVSDQDNCLILDDAFDEAAHGAYFEALARFVSDGLNACGYVYCPGDMMATNAKWRRPLATWRGYFRSWVERPEPMAQMLASVMFDLRPIHGDEALHRTLQAESLARAGSNSIFAAHMTSNALTHRPPLGMFGNFSLPRTGEHRNRIDMKHGGVVPIVDIARLHALGAGITAVNTAERLCAAKSSRVLSESGARDLLDAYGFIAITRLRHQAAQARRGERPDNFLAPDTISTLERAHLKDAFSVVKTIQAALASSSPVAPR